MNNAEKKDGPSKTLMGCGYITVVIGLPRIDSMRYGMLIAKQENENNMLILDHGLLQPHSADGTKEALYGCGCLVRLFLSAVAVLTEGKTDQAAFLLANDWAGLRALHPNPRSTASGSRQARLKYRAGSHCRCRGLRCRCRCRCR